jgi:hypothetical protein
MDETVTPMAITIVNIVVTEPADVAEADIAAAPFVEYHQRMMTIIGQRSAQSSWIAHE